MKVSELVEQLQAEDGDREVRVVVNDHGRPPWFGSTCSVQRVRSRYVDPLVNEPEVTAVVVEVLS